MLRRSWTARAPARTLGGTARKIGAQPKRWNEVLLASLGDARAVLETGPGAGRWSERGLEVRRQLDAWHDERCGVLRDNYVITARRLPGA